MPHIVHNAEDHLLLLQQMFAGYGYEKFRMSKFEDYTLYLQNEDFLKGGSILTVGGPDGRLLALKQDVTLSIVKSVQENNLPRKVYYTENVYRASHDSGDIREIPQAGVEYIGDVTVYAMSEVIRLAAESLAAVSSRYILGISHMGLVRGLLDAAALSADACTEILLCIQNKAAHTLRSICMREHLPDPLTGKLCALASIFGTMEDCEGALDDLIVNAQTAQAVQELRQLYALLCETGLGAHLRIDFSVANNMQYYNGVTFQGFLDGTPQSVLSGGRYDELVHKFGKPFGAIGFAVYLDLLRYRRVENRDERAVLVLYDPQDVQGLAAAAASLEQDGVTLHILPEAKENVRYSVMYRFTEGRLETL